MKLKLITTSLAAVLLLTACGGDGPKKTNTPPPAKPKVNAVEVVKAEEKKETAETKATETKADAPSMSPEQIAKAKEMIASISAADKAAVDVQKKYKMVCAVCHGFKGNMMINGAKDLTKSKIPLEESVAQIYFGKGLMTPNKGIMTDAEIVAVAEYVMKEISKN